MQELTEGDTWERKEVGAGADRESLQTAKQMSSVKQRVKEGKLGRKTRKFQADQGGVLSL